MTVGRLALSWVWWCTVVHFRFMPTRHPRVQVTVDPELESALSRAAPNLRSDSRAAQIRELALQGAEHLDDFDRRGYDAAVERLLEEELPDLDMIVARRHDPAA